MRASCPLLRSAPRASRPQPKNGVTGRQGDGGMGMDAKPKKRPWFQFHLSTAVVLMFVASGLLWSNLRFTEFEVESGFPGSDSYGTNTYGGYGWPMPFYVRHECFTNEAKNYADFVSPYVVSVGAAGLSGGIVLAILFTAGFLLEWRIRRQSANPSPPQDGAT